METVVSPIPGYRVIPPGWAERHRPTANGTMTGVCDIGTTATGPAPYPVPGGWTGLTPLASNLPCRVQALTSATDAWTGSQPTNSRTYLVTVPIDGLPDIPAGESGAIVVVTSSSDPHLAGRRLRVRDVQHGTLMFERDLVCVDNLTQNNPG